jgi:uncharacterized protein (TIGR00730 family)
VTPATTALQPARPLVSICVFCASSSGRDGAFLAAAREFGRLLAERGHRLVYGGGRVGLMGALADGALAAGGNVVGVIPETLVQREVAHEGLQELRVGASMHERKATMAELADAFVALPGGIGTLEELFEVWTWGQLGLHGKPCGLLDLDGYYEGLLTFLRRATEGGYVAAETLGLLVVETEGRRLLDALETRRLPRLPRRLDREET